ncbi:MAG: hypothetical protein RLZ04_2474, partial [Actinomycetota bacterium]
VRERAVHGGVERVVPPQGLEP